MQCPSPSNSACFYMTVYISMTFSGFLIPYDRGCLYLRSCSRTIRLAKRSRLEWSALTGRARQGKATSTSITFLSLLLSLVYQPEHHLTKWACFSFTHRLSLSCEAHQHHWCWQAGRLIGIKSCAVLSSPLCCEHHSCETPVTRAFLYCLL